jgi:hypothetical protein
VKFSTGNSELYLENPVRDSDYTPKDSDLPVENYSETCGKTCGKLYKLWKNSFPQVYSVMHS